MILNMVYRCFFMIQLREEVCIDVHYYVCREYEGVPTVYEINKLTYNLFPSGDMPFTLTMKEMIGDYEDDWAEIKKHLDTERGISYNIKSNDFLNLIRKYREDHR